MNFNLYCNQLSSGWAFITLRIGDLEIKMVASYLNDCFDDLLGATLRTIQGKNLQENECSFAHEPGEHILYWKRVNDVLTFEVWVFEDYDMLPLKRIREKGTCIYRGDIQLVDFIREVHWFIHRFRYVYGEEEFESQWGYPFPDQKYKALCQWVEQFKRMSQRLSA